MKKHLISLYTGAWREGIIKPINAYTHTESVQNTDEVIQSLTTCTESALLSLMTINRTQTPCTGVSHVKKKNNPRYGKTSKHDTDTPS